jgi:hypothetical protein
MLMIALTPVIESGLFISVTLLDRLTFMVCDLAEADITAYLTFMSHEQEFSVGTAEGDYRYANTGETLRAAHPRHGAVRPVATHKRGLRFLIGHLLQHLSFCAREIDDLNTYFEGDLTKAVEHFLVHPIPKFLNDISDKKPSATFSTAGSHDDPFILKNLRCALQAYTAFVRHIPSILGVAKEGELGNDLTIPKLQEEIQSSRTPSMDGSASEPRKHHFYDDNETRVTKNQERNIPRTTQHRHLSPEFSQKQKEHFISSIFDFYAALTKIDSTFPLEIVENSSMPFVIQNLFALLKSADESAPVPHRVAGSVLGLISVIVHRTHEINLETARTAWDELQSILFVPANDLGTPWTAPQPAQCERLELAEFCIKESQVGIYPVTTAVVQMIWAVANKFSLRGRGGAFPRLLPNFSATIRFVASNVLSNISKRSFRSYAERCRLFATAASVLGMAAESAVGQLQHDFAVLDCVLSGAGSSNPSDALGETLKALHEFAQVVDLSEDQKGCLRQILYFLVSILDYLHDAQRHHHESVSVQTRTTNRRELCLDLLSILRLDDPIVSQEALRCLLRFPIMTMSACAKFMAPHPKQCEQLMRTFSELLNVNYVTADTFERTKGLDCIEDIFDLKRKLLPSDHPFCAETKRLALELLLKHSRVKSPSLLSLICVGAPLPRNKYASQEPQLHSESALPHIIDGLEMVHAKISVFPVIAARYALLVHSMRQNGDLMTEPIIREMFLPSQQLQEEIYAICREGVHYNQYVDGEAYRPPTVPPSPHTYERIGCLLSMFAADVAVAHSIATDAQHRDSYHKQQASLKTQFHEPVIREILGLSDDDSMLDSAPQETTPLLSWLSAAYRAVPKQHAREPPHGSMCSTRNDLNLLSSIRLPLQVALNMDIPESQIASDVKTSTQYYQGLNECRVASNCAASLSGGVTAVLSVVFAVKTKISPEFMLRTISSLCMAMQQASSVLLIQSNIAVMTAAVECIVASLGTLDRVLQRIVRQEGAIAQSGSVGPNGHFKGTASSFCWNPTQVHEIVLHLRNALLIVGPRSSQLRLLIYRAICLIVSLPYVPVDEAILSVQEARLYTIILEDVKREEGVHIQLASLSLLRQLFMTTKGQMLDDFCAQLNGGAAALPLKGSKVETPRTIAGEDPTMLSLVFNTLLGTVNNLVIRAIDRRQVEPRDTAAVHTLIQTLFDTMIVVVGGHAELLHRADVMGQLLSMQCYASLSQVLQSSTAIDGATPGGAELGAAVDVTEADWCMPYEEDPSVFSSSEPERDLARRLMLDTVRWLGAMLRSLQHFENHVRSTAEFVRRHAGLFHLCMTAPFAAIMSRSGPLQPTAPIHTSSLTLSQQCAQLLFYLSTTYLAPQCRALVSSFNFARLLAALLDRETRLGKHYLPDTAHRRAAPEAPSVSQLLAIAMTARALILFLVAVETSEVPPQDATDDLPRSPCDDSQSPVVLMAILDALSQALLDHGSLSHRAKDVSGLWCALLESVEATVMLLHCSVKEKGHPISTKTLAQSLHGASAAIEALGTTSKRPRSTSDDDLQPKVLGMGNTRVQPLLRTGFNAQPGKTHAESREVEKTAHNANAAVVNFRHSMNL